MTNKKKWIALLFSAVLALGILAGCGNNTSPSQSMEQTEGDSAAALGSLTSFTATTLDGNNFAQDDITTKDVTVINFWSLLCGPCVEEMPDLAALEKALPDNVQLITVCLDGSGSEDTVKEILQEAGFDGTTLLTGDGDFKEICDNIQYTPTTILVNSDGKFMGDAIIGGQEDLSASYIAAINQILKSEGKAGISIEK